jgi:ParB family chromosome partitioning protein
MRDEQRGKVPHNVMGNEQGQTLQAVFEELGSITWESFVSNRLPLLNLPEDILNALQTGKIAYTKATALARVKDDEARQSLLEEAIKQDLSLSQIRERLKALQPKTEISSPSSQFDATTRRLRAAKLWENPKKWKRVQALLQKLEALLEEE